MSAVAALALLGALALVPIGCRGEAPDLRSGADTSTSQLPASTVPKAPSHSLRFELDAPTQVRVGEPVPITLRVTNTGDRPLDLYLQGREIAFDIVVAGEDGRVVWRRLEGAVVLGILQIKVLAPGEVLEFRDVWRQRDNSGQPVGPGVYTVHGALLTDDPEPMRTPSAQLRIVAR